MSTNILYEAATRAAKKHDALSKEIIEQYLAELKAHVSALNYQAVAGGDLVAMFFIAYMKAQTKTAKARNDLANAINVVRTEIILQQSSAVQSTNTRKIYNTANRWHSCTVLPK